MQCLSSDKVSECPTCSHSCPQTWSLHLPKSQHCHWLNRTLVWCIQQCHYHLLARGWGCWDGVCLMYCNIKPSRTLFNRILWLCSTPNIWSWGNGNWTFGDSWKNCWRVVVTYAPFILANTVSTWSKHCLMDFFISPSPFFMLMRPCLSHASVSMIVQLILASWGMMVEAVWETDSMVGTCCWKDGGTGVCYDLYAYGIPPEA